MATAGRVLSSPSGSQLWIMAPPGQEPEIEMIRKVEPFLESPRHPVGGAFVEPLRGGPNRAIRTGRRYTEAVRNNSADAVWPKSATQAGEGRRLQEEGRGWGRRSSTPSIRQQTRGDGGERPGSEQQEEQPRID